MPEPSGPNADERPPSDGERTDLNDAGIDESPQTSEDENSADPRDSSEPSDDRETPDDGDDSTGSSARQAVPDAGDGSSDPSARQDVPDDVRSYARFTKMDGAAYDRVNGFLRDRTYVTAREWAIARLCADFRTETGVEMTKIGENLPELVPFMTDTYSPQAVNQARASFEEKVTKSGATFLYGAMSGFFTAEELDELMYEATEVAKFLLEIEGADLTVEEELDVEDRISEVMRDVRRSSERLRAEETGHGHENCPHCGGDLTETDADD
ncbi:DUF5806 family protein [Halalkalicoccus ordinarius]|uniref:DUF5806 family protein n=1 Tax=Halalkalicoccus ordinarius TaxID=3116651 RepID=UPI00300F2CC1